MEFCYLYLLGKYKGDLEIISAPVYRFHSSINKLQLDFIPFYIHCYLQRLLDTLIPFQENSSSFDLKKKKKKIFSINSWIWFLLKNFFVHPCGAAATDRLNACSVFKQVNRILDSSRYLHLSLGSNSSPVFWRGVKFYPLFTVYDWVSCSF